MNIIEHPQPRAQAPTRGMLLHCGAQTVSREDLLAVPTPPGTQTWYPLPHRTILGEVESQLESSGFAILEETHALSHGGARYFGVMSVTLPGRAKADSRSPTSRTTVSGRVLSATWRRSVRSR